MEKISNRGVGQDEEADGKSAKDAACKQAADDHIMRQSGDHLAAEHYPEAEDVRYEFVRVCKHFLTPKPWTSSSPTLRELRRQRLLSGTVRVIGAEDTQHGSESLARFVVRATSEVERRLALKSPNPLNYLHNTARRHQIIRRQLRLPLRSKTSAASRAVRRYDRVFCAIIGRKELRRSLLSLLRARSGSPTRAKNRFRQSLEALFRHLAPMQTPSLETSIKDIIVLHQPKIQSLKASAPKNQLPNSIANAAIAEQLRQFRTRRKLSQPKAKGDVAKGKSFEVIVRRVRAKLQKDYGTTF